MINDIRRNLIEAYQASAPMRFGTWIMGGWLVLCLFAAAIVPSVVRSTLVNSVGPQLHLNIRIADVDYEPFGLGLSLEQIEARSPQDALLFSADEVYVNAEIWRSLLQWSIVLNDVWLISPFVQFEKLDADTTNFSFLSTLSESTLATEAAEATPANDNALLPITLRRTLIDNGRFRFADHTKTPLFEATFEPLHLDLANLSTKPNRDAPYQLNVQFGDARLLWEGDVSLQPLQSRGTLELGDIDLAALSAYLQDATHLHAQRGLLDIAMQYDVNLANPEIPQVILSEGRVAVRELSVIDTRGETEILRMPSLTLDGIAFDLSAKQASARAFTLNDTQWVVERNADGELALQSAIKSPAPDDTAAHTDEPNDEPVDTTTDAANGTSWNASLAVVAINNNVITLQDASVPGTPRLPLHVHSLAINDFRFPMTAPWQWTLAATVAESGTWSAQGAVQMHPALQTDVKTELTGLSVAALNPWLQNALLADIDGSLTLDMAAQITPRDGSDEPAIRADGNLALQGLRVSAADATQPVLVWDSLSLKPIRFSSPNPLLTIGEIRVQQPGITLQLDAEGNSNVAALFPAPEAGAAAGGSTATPAPRIAIQRIAVQGGSLQFADASPDRLFQVALGEIQATIDNLSSTPGKRATLSITGTVDEYAPMTVAGELDPLSATPFADIKTRLTNFDMTSLSPYTQTYIAFPIDQGRLGLDLDWQVDGSTFSSTNHINVQTMKLGERIPSERATKLPVRLGLALLSDSAGNMQLDVPASGDLSDPSVTVRGILLKAFTNLINRAVTSPFAAVGAVGALATGGGDSIGIDFIPGTATTVEQTEDRIAIIAGTLTKKPKLALSLRGTAWRGSDTASLQRERFEQALLARWLQKPMNRIRGSSAPPPSAEERTALIVEWWTSDAAKTSATATDPLAAGTDVALVQAEAGLLATFVISDDDLRTLARSRAMTAKSLLVAAGIGEERLQLKDSVIHDGDAVPAPLELEVDLR